MTFALFWPIPLWPATKPPRNAMSAIAAASASIAPARRRGSTTTVCSSSLGGSASAGGSSGGGPAATSSSCTRSSRARSSGARSSPTSSSKSGPKSDPRSMQFLLQLVRQPCQRGPCSCLDRPQWNTKVLRHLGLGQSAPVRKLDHRAFVRRQLLQGAVDAPRGPARLGAVGRACVVRLLVGRLDRRLAPCPRAVDDRVPCDGVDPRAARTALRPVAVGSAPDGYERLLDGVLGAPPVAKPAQREAENRPRVPAVERFERAAVALAGAKNELSVGRVVRRHLPHGCGYGRSGQADNSFQRDFHTVRITGPGPRRIAAGDRRPRPASSR